MVDRTFTLHIKARWLRVAALAALVAVVVVPTTAIASHRFADVPDSNTFHDDISAIADAGVTFGCNPPANTLYCPDGKVTRGQMAAFLNRLGALSGQTPVVNAKTAQTADTLDGFDSTDFLKVGEGGGGDADTLDGLDSLAFWQKTESVDAATLDGIDSTGFVAQGEADSVTSAMTTSEAGVAQNTRTAAVAVSAGPGTYENIDTVSVTAPSSGYVIVMASMQVKAVHASTVQDHATIDVSDTSAALVDTNNTKNYVFDTNATPGTYTIVASVQRAFPVSAGPQTFYLVANEISGEIEIDDVTITAIFVPSAYGTVEEIG